MPTRNAKLSYQGDADDDDEDEDSDEENTFCKSCGATVDADASFCNKCGAPIDRTRRGGSSCARWLTCCGAGICILLLGVVILGVLAFVYLDTWVKASIEYIGTAAVGSKVTVDNVDIDIQSGHVLITGLQVGNPSGYGNAPPLFHLGTLAFDMDPWSVAPLVMGQQQTGGPLIIHQLTIQQVNVSIEQPSITRSNAKQVTQHLVAVTKAIAPVVGLPDFTNLTAEQKEALMHGAKKTLLTKVIVGKIQFSDIGTSYCFYPLCKGIAGKLGSGPMSFGLKEVRLDGVGQDRNGVYVIELILDIITAILMSVIKTAPSLARLNLLKSLWPLKELGGDCHSVLYSAGTGLVKITEFTGWATTQMNLLPLRAAAMNAKLGMKGAEFGMKTNMAAAKLGLKGAEFGAKANLEAAKLGVKANVKAAKFGAKMVGMGARLGAAFAGGAAKAMTGAVPHPLPLPPPPPPPPPR